MTVLNDNRNFYKTSDAPNAKFWRMPNTEYSFHVYVENNLGVTILHLSWIYLYKITLIYKRLGHNSVFISQVAEFIFP